MSTARRTLGCWILSAFLERGCDPATARQPRAVRSIRPLSAIGMGTVHTGVVTVHAFFAEIRGATQVVAFQPARDVLEIWPSKQIPILRELLDSGFQATHWLVRPDAVHAKSRTYREMPAGA